MLCTVAQCVITISMMDIYVYEYNYKPSGEGPFEATRMRGRYRDNSEKESFRIVSLSVI